MREASNIGRIAARFAALDIVPTLSVWEAMGADQALNTYHWQFLAVPAPVSMRPSPRVRSFARWYGDRPDPGRRSPRGQMRTTAGNNG